MRTKRFIIAKRKAIAFFGIPPETPIREVCEIMKERCRVEFEMPDNKKDCFALIYCAFAIREPRLKQNIDTAA